MMLLAQAVVLIPSVTANISPDSTLRTTFSNDDISVIIQFDSLGDQIQPGASLEIPRNSTVEALNFGLTYNSTNSPGNFWLDMNEDGIPELPTQISAISDYCQTLPKIKLGQQYPICWVNVDGIQCNTHVKCCKL